MNWTFGLSLASLIYGVLFYILTIAVLGTPPADIGMVSTTVVFLLFGIFGLLLHRVQSGAAATTA